MNSTKDDLVSWLVFLLMGLMGGCFSGAHSTASHSPESSPSTFLAQVTCWDTESCCIQRDPASAVERCGADPIRVASILKTLGTLNEVTQAAEGSESAPVAAEAETTATGTERTPKWKKECIKKYVECINRKWVGNCHDCLRYCEGQHTWPADWCYAPEN